VLCSSGGSGANGTVGSAILAAELTGGPAMGKLKSVKEMFEGRHFSAEVIILCVRWYL
jgi:hypothetical protein